MAMDAEAREAGAEGAYENAWQGGTVEIRRADTVVLATAAIPATNNASFGSPDGSVGNDVAIVLNPGVGVDDTANDVRVRDAGGDVRNTYAAASVLNSVNIVEGNPITIAINDLRISGV